MNSPYTTFTSTPSRRATLIGFGAFGIATLAGCAPLRQECSKLAEQQLILFKL